MRVFGAAVRVGVRCRRARGAPADKTGHQRGGGRPRLPGNARRSRGGARRAGGRGGSFLCWWEAASARAGRAQRKRARRRRRRRGAGACGGGRGGWRGERRRTAAAAAGALGDGRSRRRGERGRGPKRGLLVGGGIGAAAGGGEGAPEGCAAPSASAGRSDAAQPAVAKQQGARTTPAQRRQPDRTFERSGQLSSSACSPRLAPRSHRTRKVRFKPARMIAASTLGVAQGLRLQRNSAASTSQAAPLASSSSFTHASRKVGSRRCAWRPPQRGPLWRTPAQN